MAKLEKQLYFGIHNKFMIEVVDAKTKEIKQKAQAFNVICNSLYNMLVNYLFYNNYNLYANGISYGSGSGTPSASDTALFHREGAKSVEEISHTFDYDRQVATRVVRIVLGVSEANGVTITEVGLTQSAYDTTISTHAMLQDMNGNPITITKTDTDVINIYATIYVHYANGGGAELLHTPWVSYSWSSFTWALAGRSSVWSSGSGWSNPAALQVKIPGSINSWTGDIGSPTYTKDTTNKRITISKRIDVSQWNTVGVNIIGMRTQASNTDGNQYKAFLFTNGNRGIGSFNVTGEAVGTGDGSTTKFKTKFHCPYNATVYVNGVAQTSGVTVKSTPNIDEHNTAVTSAYGAMYISKNSTPTDILPDTYDRGTPRWYYNMCYRSGDGVTSVQGTDSGVSNDLVNWESVSGTLTPAQRAKKFFRTDGNSKMNYDGYNIVFDTAPNDGDVITIDYSTDFIPKDVDHVIDISIVLQFGEWQGE